MKRQREDSDIEDDELKSLLKDLIKQRKKSRPLPSSPDSKAEPVKVLNEMKICDMIEKVAFPIMHDAIIKAEVTSPEVKKYIFFVKYPNVITLDHMESLALIPGIIKVHLDPSEVGIMKVTLTHSLVASVRHTHDELFGKEQEAIFTAAVKKHASPIASTASPEEKALYALLLQLETNIYLDYSDPNAPKLTSRILDDGIQMVTATHLVQCPIRLEQARNLNRGIIKNVSFISCETQAKINIVVDYTKKE